MRLWTVSVLILSTAVGCHSATAPVVTQRWDYEAPALTDGQVVCTFAAPMSLSRTNGPFTGTFVNGYMSCSGPNGASSTLVSGTVDAGTVTGSAITFGFTTTDIANSGEVSATTGGFTNSGTVTNNTTKMTGTATVSVTLGGLPYTLTGTWQAKII